MSVKGHALPSSHVRAESDLHPITDIRWRRWPPQGRCHPLSTKGSACFGITDARGLLVGIITDGDLRRHMRNNLLDARVDEIMTREPKSVRPDQLISETLDILNSLKVTALFAVEAGKPVGIIHVHDLLRAGAA